jgi:glycosyltransferase involved in cell wall biosynthesis
MTTILMVSGSWPPQACGVGDYSERLCCELEQNGIAAVRFAKDKLSRPYSLDVIRQVNEMDCDLVHIQYPTAGYGRSFTPSALPSRVRDKPVVVTLHEYSVFRWYRRPWFSPFARRCATRIFTTDEERQLFARRFPSRNGIDLTVEIASNIPVAASATRRAGRVSYFGLIAPNKGIEAFLDLCEIAGANPNDLTFELIGAVPDRHRRYAEAVLQRASACNALHSIDLPNDAVAKRLATSTFAYLPFPDGASAKRGTLAAAIVNGLIVITRHTPITPEWIRSATLDTKTPADALQALTRLQQDGRQCEAAAKRSALAASRFRWDAIAQRHADLYRHLLNIPAESERDVASAPMASASYESRLAS